MKWFLVIHLAFETATGTPVVDTTRYEYPDEAACSKALDTVHDGKFWAPAVVFCQPDPAAVAPICPEDITGDGVIGGPDLLALQRAMRAKKQCP